jgi:hypothetical protein
MDALTLTWDRLAFRHLVSKDGSVADLADLHAFVNKHRDDAIEIRGESLQLYPHTVSLLDRQIETARLKNDFTFLRRYARAVEFASAGKTHKLDLTAHSLAAWRQLRESLGRPPIRKEVVAWVEKDTGVKFTPRQWRRVFTDLAELFEPSE